MTIIRQASAGSLESSDCFVMVRPDKDLKIDLESIVINRYGQKIRQVILQTIKEMGINNGYFKIQDKGALDYCLRARVRTVIKRAGEEDDR
ncbi:MAG: citrate lyase acyl carrier protein [Tepidanaerobacteraceae bacterium]|nr:citrate lyase acyl carrier protein [Tepidanaerobacteraceae bacterium]